MAEEEKHRKKKRKRGGRVLSGPQFATHVFGGGYYLGPGNYGYGTAQDPQGDQGDDDDGGAGDGGGEGGGL